MSTSSAARTRRSQGTSSRAGAAAAIPPRRELARRAAITVGSTLRANRLLDPGRTDRPLRNVVVVTGPHRSGTTVIGELLNHARRTFVLHEPFNLDWGLHGVPRRYPSMTAADADSVQATALRQFLITGDGTWMGHGEPLPPTHRRAREFRRLATGLRPWGYSAIIKDPFLLLALRWINTGLSEHPPIVTLRHPAAWVASLLRRTMHPRAAITSFREQHGFGDPVIQDLLDQADWESADIPAAGAVTWACLVRMLDQQLDDGARAMVLRMEDFAADPHGTLETAYHTSGLTPPPKLDRIVEQYTAGDVVTPKGRVLHELRRNSAALATAWRTQLSADDQTRIRSITEAHATRWYTDW